MRGLLKRSLTMVLAAALLTAGFPAEALAAGDTGSETPEKLELKDDYISVTVSGENGGFLIDTVTGDKLKKSDDNKFLLYPSEDYDTSYTSFRVTREDGSVKDYIFGRDYGFAGLSSSDVTLRQEGQSLVASWSVDDITVEQRLSLLDESATQHGMVSIGYTVTAQSDDIADVKMRMLVDTALGYQDYAVYEVPDERGEYSHVRTEQMLENTDGGGFNGMLYAVNDPGAPTVSAYTVNTTLDGETVVPYQVGFGHWNNLASTVFDFVPDESLDFTNAYNAEYMTADSAYALYYELGSLEAGKSADVSTYYGVFSNATVGNEERAAINFPVLPGSMALNDKGDAYISQVEGGNPGDIELQMNIENITANAVDAVTVVVRSQNNVTPYESWYDNLLYEDELENFTTVIDDFQPGEVAQATAYFQVTPLPASEYRKFEVLCYDAGRGETLTQEKLLGSREFYVFCPGKLGEVVTFNSIEPQTVYTEGTKNLYISGQNMSLMRDTSAYVTYLRSLSGRADVKVPANKVTVDAEKNTMFLQVDSELEEGSYQVVFDWNEQGKEDTTSPMFQFTASAKPEYAAPTYGIVTIEKAADYNESTAYELHAYMDEADYEKRMTDPDNRVLLEFRGNFTLWYGDNGNITEAKAVSREEVDGTVSGTINISNCLDVEAGTLNIVVSAAGTDEQVIETNIDAKVYTTNSRTKVWDGVCAISSIENGSESTLLQYNYDGTVLDDLKHSVANTNAITLMWPGAASTAQNIAGVLMEFRYCQFGQMRTKLYNPDKPEDNPKRRVIAFGAEMSPDFLVPTNFDWGNRQTSTLEVVQLKLAKSNYTADQLREVQARYAADQEAWEEAEGGSLGLYVHDILFGGGFVGFNTSLEVGIPSYTEGMPSVEGILNLNIMPANKTWAVGVDGSADFSLIAMEASLELKALNNIPVPNKIYFYLGGMTPGINVDGMGVFWIQGLGGGVDDLYDSLFVSSTIPPLTVMMSGQFALFALMQARADLSMSMRGFRVNMSNIGLKGIELIENVGLYAYWYPRLQFGANMKVDILSIIEGGGYIVVEEDNRDGSDGGIFWEGFVTASIKTPKIPLIGEITIGSADLGVNAAKIWGALHVLMMDMGVTYYWGGDVDFAFGKYDAPEPTLPVAAMMSDIPVYADEATGQILYMSVGTNAVLAASDTDKHQGYAAYNLPEKPEIVSNTERTNHEIYLGKYSGDKDMALVLNFDAESEDEAERICRNLTLTDEDGKEYPLTWLDHSEDAPGAEEQTDANATYVWLGGSEDQGNSAGKDTASALGKKVSVLISFTKEESYGHSWTLNTDIPLDAALYAMKHLPGIDSAEYTSNGSQMEVSWEGSMLDKLSSLTVYGVDEEEQMHLLYDTDDRNVISGKQVSFTLPETLPSGIYQLQVVAANEAESASSIVDAGELKYINPNQPEAPTLGNAGLGGDYSIDVEAAANGTYDGYIVSVYEKDGGEWKATDFTDQWITADAEGKLPETLTVGGRYEVPAWEDAAGNRYTAAEAEKMSGLTATTEYVGLEAGKTYRVQVKAYKNTADGTGIYMSDEVVSSEVTMKEPSPANVTVSVQGAKNLTDELAGLTDTEGTLFNSTIAVVNQTKVTVDITSDRKAAGTWTLDGGMAEGKWEANPSGTITLTGRQATEDLDAEDGLTEGEHILMLKGEDEDGNGVLVQYPFRVDATAPKLQLAAPYDGAFFSDKVTVSGISEPGARVYVTADGQSEQALFTDADGNFSADLAMDMSKLEQELTLYAVDEAGNKSRTYSLKLTNEILGAKDLALAVFLNGADYTGKTLPAGTVGELELRAVSGSRSVVIPANSNVGRQAEWELKLVDGSASLDGQKLTSDNAANGMLTVTLDRQQTAVVLGGNRTSSGETHTVQLPQDPVGYTVGTGQELSVQDGDSFTFRVDVSEGYTAGSDFAVYANGVELAGNNGEYTIKDIHSDKTIMVTGVADVTAPSVEITVGGTSWKDCIQNVMFGNIFNKSQIVAIKATDAGSGVGQTMYYISEKALTETEVQTLGEDVWTEYDKAFSIGKDESIIIYAKAVDKAGNIKYCSTDGLVFDGTAPVIQGIENGGVYYGNQTFTVQDANGVQVTVDGKEVELSDGSYTLNADNKEHMVKAVDTAGNVTEYVVTVYRIYQVEFVIDGRVVTTMSANYGSSIPADQFPEIPAKEGYQETAPYWNPSSLENITSDMTVQAVYTPDTKSYPVSLPKDTVGYTVSTEQDTLVKEGSDFTFKVEILEGYSMDEGFAVCVNEIPLAGEDGVYTIRNVDSEKVVTVRGVADLTAPELEIRVKDQIWKKFLNTITFGKFFKESQKVTVAAEDNGSGMDQILYYISDRALKLEEVQALDADAWKEYTEAFTIDPDHQYVIYAKAVDKAGNTAYGSSDGLVLDSTAPVIVGVEDGGIYYGDLTVRVQDFSSVQLTVDGEAVELANGCYTLKADNAEHVVKAVDAAGNVTEYTVTVYQICQVEFVIDGTVVKNMPVNYGSSIPADQFPEIPAKEGYQETAPYWNPSSLENITSDMTVQAVYTPDTKSYPVSLPKDTVGYTVSTEQDTLVKEGSDFTFKVEILEGYSMDEGFAVCVNEIPLAGEDGVYTIRNVDSEKVVTVRGVADLTAPELEIRVKDQIWKKFLNTITFGKFFKESQKVAVSATDNGSGMDQILYYVSDRALRLEEVQALDADAWKEYTEAFTIDPDHQYVIYAKAVDKAGNTAYGSSDGLVLDSTAPVIVGVEDGGIYYGDLTVRVQDFSSVQLTVDGEAVELANGCYTLKADNAEHVVKAVDAAGNVTEYTVTVYQIYQVEFVIDGRVVTTMSANYGSSIPADQFPEIPAKEGYQETAPYWNPSSLENITSDMTVQAVYTPDTKFYSVSLPKDTVGYTVSTEQDTLVKEGSDFTFEVEILEGYSMDEGFAVCVNEIPLAGEDGVYTIRNVDSEKVVTVRGVADLTAPELEIRVKDQIWKKFLNTITFGKFFKESQKVAVSATDNGSGMDQILYYVSDSALKLEEVQALDADAWKEYTEAFTIDPDHQYVIYAKAVDKEGNTTYASSDGLVLDSTAPVIVGVEDGGIYSGDLTVQVQDFSSVQLTVDGEAVELANGCYTLKADNAKHVLKVTDAAGNVTEYTVTVNVPDEGDKPDDGNTTPDDGNKPGTGQDQPSGSDKQNGDSVRTNDSREWQMWLLLVCIGGGVAVIAAVKKRKKEQ